MEVPVAVFFFEEGYFSDDLIDLLGAVTFNVTLKMVAECTPPPIASSGSQVWKNEFWNKVFIQRQSVEIGGR